MNYIKFISLITFFIVLTSVISYSDQSTSNKESLDNYSYEIVNEIKSRWKREDDLSTSDVKLKKTSTKKAYSLGLSKPLNVKEKALVLKGSPSSSASSVSSSSSPSSSASSVANNNNKTNAEETMKTVTNEMNNTTSSTTSTTTTTVSSTIVNSNSTADSELTVDQADMELNNTANVTKVDNHEYYISTYHLNAEDGLKFWIDLDKIPNEKVITHETLSNSHRKAITVELNFTFPFYGHPIKNITIATGGFLYTGGSLHTWLAATQYIAALMANFDTSLSKESKVQYYDNSTCFTVQWTKVRLQESNQTFTFQAQLHSSGKIIFVYKELPIPIDKISDEKHPVKVGISDAYIVERSFFFLRRKTIFEYHRVEFNKPLTSGSAIEFDPLPTCVSFTDCKACLTTKINFTCAWCAKINRCSSGVDRYRQEWLMEKCESRSINNTDQCPVNNANDTTSTDNSVNIIDDHHNNHHSDINSNSIDANTQSKVYAPDVHSGGSKAAVISVIMIIAIIAGLSMWIFYAYKNPQSSSGQLLIKYRPSRWNWNGLETRYTAASIHM